jgi:PiT family inorganic phosphate transporter
MLILIGTVPTAYALNRALPESQIQQFTANSSAASTVIERKGAGFNVLGNPRPAVTNYVAQHQINEGTYPSLAVLVRDIANQVTQYGSLAKFPADAVGNTRNDMYHLVSEAIRFLMKDKESELNSDEVATLKSYKGVARQREGSKQRPALSARAPLVMRSVSCDRPHAASVFSTSLIQYEVPNTIASSLKL